MAERVAHEVEISPSKVRGGDIVELDGEFHKLTHRYKGPGGRTILGSRDKDDREIRGETIEAGAKVKIRLQLKPGECPRCHIYEREHGAL